MIQKSSLVKEIKQQKEWETIVDSFPEKDIYFTYDYMQPFQNNGDGEPILFYLESHLGKVMYPFLYRDIAESPNLKEKIPEKTYFDISTVYGYGGPIVEMHPAYDSVDAYNALTEEFHYYFSHYCDQKGIVSQFDRFHPFLNTHEFFTNYCEVTLNKKTVSMDLQNVDDMTQNLTSGCRNKIRQAEKKGVTIVVDDDIQTLEVFIEMYTRTMKHNQATNYYFFNEHFFEDVKQVSREHMMIANAYYEGEIIASALILYFDGYLHHHFSGSMSEYRQLKPNNLLFYEIAKWGSQQGYELFHLGGGHAAENDSLFRFKKSFSKSEPKDFYIGKRIHNQEKYTYLSELTISNTADSTDYFPAYRR